MKYVIPGGSGVVGQGLAKALLASGHSVRVLSRNPSDNEIKWDGQNLGDWASCIDGADVVVNLAGRTVNCRYTKKNLKQMMDSRVDSTRVVGEAIAQAANPPRVWLQMSTATIYAHTFGDANDDVTGVIGGGEPDVPRYWDYSIDIAKAWEAEQEKADTPRTRKVALRTAMVMGRQKGGIFDVLCGLTRKGLGGTLAGGKQYMSWIHEDDFSRAIEFLVESDLQGAVNLAAPNPLPQKEFQAALRKALGVKIGLPAMKWMVKLGAIFMRTDPELVLKSRKVVSKRIVDSGFEFEFSIWKHASDNLVQKS
ncbi:MAG: TIGR01777 family oxidoreductase [Planctomycetes bacterium]|nr:TIGR01777 family oxidoreductase [Planctomycetota bacterium]